MVVKSSTQLSPSSSPSSSSSSSSLSPSNAHRSYSISTQYYGMIDSNRLGQQRTATNAMARNCGFAEYLRTFLLPALPSQFDELIDNFKRQLHLKMTQHWFDKSNATGKIKVIACVQQSSSSSSFGLDKIHNLLPAHHSLNLISAKSDRYFSNSCVKADLEHGQVILIDPNPVRKKAMVPALKHFSFDAVLTDSMPKIQLCTAVLFDTLVSVIHGQDNCIISIGHKGTEKTTTLMGFDNLNPSELGIIPCAISWLYQLLTLQKEHCQTRFSIRVSAVEIFGSNEQFRDLLADTNLAHNEEFLAKSPSQYLCNSPHQSQSKLGKDDCSKSAQNGVEFRIREKMKNIHELPTSSIEQLACIFDFALANRSRAILKSKSHSDVSHMLFTIYLYQCKLESNENDLSNGGGCTKLHFLDLGNGRHGYSSKVQKQSYKGSKTEHNSLSFSGISKVLLSLLTGQRHIPLQNSPLAYLLKEILTGNRVQPCIVAHVSDSAQYYAETLQIIQVASEIGKLRKRKIALANADSLTLSSQAMEDNDSSSLIDTDDGSQQRSSRRRRPRLGRLSYPHSTFGSCSSDFDCTSSGEQTCDTVIYVGKDRRFGNLSLSNSLNNLGPRGTADGSIDAHQMAHDCEENNEFGRLRKRSNCGLIKRMMPRTNVSVRPRTRHLRKVWQRLGQHQGGHETWIDGPKAHLNDDLPTTPTTITTTKTLIDTSLIEHKNVQSEAVSPTHTKLINNNSNLKGGLTHNDSTKPIQRCQDNFRTSPLPLPITDNNLNSNNAESFKIDNISHNDGESNHNCFLFNQNAKVKTTRALSDISERTDETEQTNVKDSNLVLLADNSELSIANHFDEMDDNEFFTFPLLKSTSTIFKVAEEPNSASHNQYCSSNSLLSDPTKALLDIGRQIREASQSSLFTVPADFATVNVPQYLKQLQLDDFSENLNKSTFEKQTEHKESSSCNVKNNNNKFNNKSNDEVKTYDNVKQISDKADTITKNNYNYKIKSNRQSAYSTNKEFGKLADYNHDTNLVSTSVDTSLTRVAAWINSIANQCPKEANGFDEKPTEKKSKLLLFNQDPPQCSNKKSRESNKQFFSNNKFVNTDADLANVVIVETTAFNANTTVVNSQEENCLHSTFRTCDNNERNVNLVHAPHFYNSPLTNPPPSLLSINEPNQQNFSPYPNKANCIPQRSFNVSSGIQYNDTDNKYFDKNSCTISPRTASQGRFNHVLQDQSPLSKSQFVANWNHSLHSINPTILSNPNQQFSRQFYFVPKSQLANSIPNQNNDDDHYHSDDLKSKKSTIKTKSISSKIRTLSLFKNLRLGRKNKSKSKICEQTTDLNDNDHHHHHHFVPETSNENVSSNLTSFGFDHSNGMPNVHPSYSNSRRAIQRSHPFNHTLPISNGIVIYQTDAIGTTSTPPTNEYSTYFSSNKIENSPCLPHCDKDLSARLLSTPSSTALSLLSGKFSASVQRSGRRSINGGPSSSGYESMRTGVSELSLSHPDSASECSGKGQNMHFLRDQFVRRASLDANRYQTSYGTNNNNNDHMSSKNAHQCRH